jgi:anti-sigma factor RsiW
VNVGKLAEEGDDTGGGGGGVSKNVKSKLEAALTAKQEAEAKVASMEGKITQYEAALAEYKTRVFTLQALLS